MNRFVFIKCIFLVSLVKCDLSLVSVKSWKQLDYQFPNSQLREFAIKHGLFIQQNAVPIEAVPDCLSTGKKRIFISMPRFVPGVPVTLGTISPVNKDYIKPYPDYSWHSSHGLNCDAMTSVFRVVIDECQRMWVLDTGKIENTQFCPPQILIFDLITDRLITRYKIPSENYSEISLLISQVRNKFRVNNCMIIKHFQMSQVIDVDDPPPIGHCANAKAYIADTTGFGLIVFDLASETSWRVQSKLFHPDLRFGRHTIAGESFELPDGLFGLALSKKKQEGDNRLLYFHSLASIQENAVPLDILNNGPLWDLDQESVPWAFTPIGQRLSQTPAEAMDKNGNLWFVLMNPIALACWDSSTDYNPNNIKIILRDEETLQFASGMKVINSKSGDEELWITTNRFQVSFETIKMNI